MNRRNIRRGDIYYTDLNPVIGSEEGGVRPILIISNDIGNKRSPTVLAAAITSKIKPDLPTHVYIGTECGISENSTVMLEQIRTIDKRRLFKYIGHLEDNSMKEIDKAISVSFGLINID